MNTPSGQPPNPVVYTEVSQTAKPHADTLGRLLAVSLLSNDVDLGEAEAIVLAPETSTKIQRFHPFSALSAVPGPGLNPTPNLNCPTI